MEKAVFEKPFRDTSVSNLSMTSDGIFCHISLSLNMTKMAQYDNTKLTTCHTEAFKPEVSQRFCKQCKI
ncbi:hypothetical protein [Helicobacter sp. MIT 01-3238]|uniref:hypothetical protein n=1 Tax=Helicobacter sp. MIT 01-3238 TaxID=398627 RepID=UPI0011C02095|nr:hypothetical protein [Helicobacter sp. MIT 01-3238]